MGGWLPGEKRRARKEARCGICLAGQLACGGSGGSTGGVLGVHKSKCLRGQRHRVAPAFSAEGSPCRRPMSFGTHDGCYGACVVCKDGGERIGHTGDIRGRPFRHLRPIRQRVPLGVGQCALAHMMGAMGPVWCAKMVSNGSATPEIQGVQVQGFRPFRQRVPLAAGH